jgi:hypothetical protein
MIAVLDTLNEYIWISDFTALCVFALLALRLGQNLSTLMTLALVVLLSGTIIKYEALVNGFVSPATDATTLMLWSTVFALVDCAMAYVLYKHYRTVKIRYKTKAGALFAVTAMAFLTYTVYLQYGPMLFDFAGPSYKVWVIVAFYFGGSLIDGLAIYTIHKFHIVTNKTHSVLARTYTLAFFVTANMQMLRFAEKYFWESNGLEYVYQMGLASVNVCTSVVTIIITCLAVFQFYNKQPRKGVLWNF